MQHVSRFFLVLFLALACTAFFAGESPAAQAASAESQYRKVAADWKTLLGDTKRVSQRDPWLNLERRFLDVAASDKGDAGAKAQYQAARCREELAKRSHQASDWRTAANLFLDLGKKYPKHSLADDGFFLAASVVAKQLNRPDEARTIAQTVLDSYPKGDMAGNARTLLASLQQDKGGSGKPAARASAQTSEKPSSASPPARSAPKAAPKAASRTAQQAADLTGVVCRGTSQQSTVFLELDGAAAFRHQYLAATAKLPARLVVDIDSVGIGAGVSSNAPFTGMTVSRVRTSQTASKGKKGVRVIIEFGNVRQYTVETGTNPPGIHVRSSTSRDLAGGTTPPAGGKNGPSVQGKFSGLGNVQPGTLMEQLGLTVKTIMIDAGHGGKDPGAIANTITEKQVTLTLANLLGELLKKQGFTVLFTRQRDVFVPLDQRAVIANEKKADLFISLHVNASTDTKTNGLETYFLDLARTSSAATVAARENAVSVKSISDLQFILTDLMLTSKLQESQDLAATVHRRMFSRLTTAGFTMSDNGVRSAPFYVLMGARMPAVLVEIGYCSNADDSRRIKSAKYLERLAEGVAQGVVEYKDKLARFTGK